MKLHLGELKTINEGLTVVREQALPAQTAYWFVRIIQQIQPEFAAFEEARKALVTQYAEKDENGLLKTEESEYGDQAIIEDKEGFQREYEELALQEVEIKYDPITIKEFGKINIKPIDLIKLGRLVKDEEE